MVIHYLRHATLIAALLTFIAAQDETIIPDDLQSGFRPDGDEVQVSFTGDAVNGFKDGTVFEKEAVAEEPTFALGDSSGISSSTLYTIIMVDTTCPDTRRLHYARANFKYNFEITNINTSSPALLDYIAPGSVEEKGDNRQYSFLMYTNPGRKEITDLQLPGDNEAFDVTQFQNDNGLGDAMAGVGMVVKLGGETNCTGGNAEALPSNLPTPRPAKSTAVEVSTTLSPENATASDLPTPAPTSTRSPANSNTASLSDLPSSAAEPSATVSTIVLSSADGTISSKATTAAEETANAAPVTIRCQRWGMASLLAIVSFIFV
ncbi:hypothetical protein AG0111_0g8443 [Alternaria gaisen]|uniref:Uncharacterized protein n=1 Tax=Alternaria gaisen TaxID=167740 RepID=A0ACB6FH47_9PLEO|nr:hypothetical protein AG0111_0g8443 [Alternaria gaisen]